MSRQAFEPTDEQRKNVEEMARIGLTEENICLIVRDHKGKPVLENTLRKHFRRELDTADLGMRTRVGNFMISTIFGEKVPHGIVPITDERVRGRLLELYMKTRAGMSETLRVGNEKGKDGKAVPFQLVISKADLAL